MLRFFSFKQPQFLTTPFARRVASCLVIFITSTLLILPNLSYPRLTIFDEVYFIPAAQKYLNHVFFLEPHPPLGKLLIAAGQYWLHPDAPSNSVVDSDKMDKDWDSNEDILGYRLVPAFLGILNPLLIFLILAIALRRNEYAFVLGMGVAFDNALLIQSRAALLDSSLLFFCLASVFAFLYQNHRLNRPVWKFLLISAIWGAVAACAANVKLTGLFVLILVPVLVVRLLRIRQFARTLLCLLVFGIVFAGVFLGLWQIHFSIATQMGNNNYGASEEYLKILSGDNQPDALTRFVIEMRDAFDFQRRYESGVPKLDLGKPDEIGSPWYWWPFGGRAISYRWETPDNGVSYRYSYLIGNPVTWLVSLLGVLFGTAIIMGDLLFRFIPQGHRFWLYLFAALYWAYMVPMMFITRVMYLYHYFPPLTMGVVLFGVVLWEAQTLPIVVKRSILILVLIAGIIAYWIYSPFTYFQLITPQEFMLRNIWSGWDMRCAGCSS